MPNTGLISTLPLVSGIRVAKHWNFSRWHNAEHRWEFDTEKREQSGAAPTSIVYIAGDDASANDFIDAAPAHDTQRVIEVRLSIARLSRTVENRSDRSSAI